MYVPAAGNGLVQSTQALNPAGQCLRILNRLAIRAYGHRANADIHADGRPMSFFTDFDPVNREMFPVFDRDFQGL